MFLLTIRPPPRSTLFPYTTLFRSIKKQAKNFTPQAESEKHSSQQEPFKKSCPSPALKSPLSGLLGAAMSSRTTKRLRLSRGLAAVTLVTTQAWTACPISSAVRTCLVFANKLAHRTSPRNICGSTPSGPARERSRPLVLLGSGQRPQENDILIGELREIGLKLLSL